MLPLTPQTMPFDPPGGWQRCLNLLLRRPYAVLFDSALPGELARQSFLSFGPTMLLSCTGLSATWVRGKSASRLEGDPLEVFERVETFTRQECPLREPATVEGFYGGWAGLLGFDLRCSVESLPPPKVPGPQFPDLFAGFYPWTLAYDSARGTCELRHLRGAPGAFGDIAELALALEALLAEDTPVTSTRLGSPELSTSREDFLAGVTRVKHYIREGDIYQANLTREVVRHGECDPIALYGELRTRNAAPFGGFLDCGDGRCVLSSSPERFLSVRDGLVETRPIKGTRPRSNDAEKDARLKAELESSAKDRAELTMIIDLERNDLSRVCVPGTVKVPHMLRVHSFASVHHLEATVQGRLRDDISPVALLRATFPGGSISGAPKKRALQILHELEPVRRGPYTGSLFYLTPDFRLESNILIRTLLREPGRVSYHVGGGIVADSEPEAEWDETVAKAAALEAALEAAP
ncbi:MAG: anthranilate synthase component I family protein [Planctomycetes bacterium]|nr:anthranilate synthase component I family protein [Planctomycetota bacterium]